MRVGITMSCLLLADAIAPSAGAAQGATTDYQPVTIEFKLDEDTTARLSNVQLARVEPVLAEEGVVLNLWFTEEGSERLARLTDASVGRLLTVLVNSKVVSAAAIAEPIHPGTKQPIAVAVPLPRQAAESLAQAVTRTWPPRHGVQ
jgi:preprotein translocase subunit SecD